MREEQITPLDSGKIDRKTIMELKKLLDQILKDWTKVALIFAIMLFIAIAVIVILDTIIALKGSL